MPKIWEWGESEQRSGAPSLLGKCEGVQRTAEWMQQSEEAGSHGRGEAEGCHVTQDSWAMLRTTALPDGSHWRPVGEESHGPTFPWILRGV